SSGSEDGPSNRSRKHKRAHRHKKKDKDKGKARQHNKRDKRKVKENQKDSSSSPVQLSKFLGRDKDDGVRRSAVSGKKILLKLDKTKEDKKAENNRNQLLKFLNASYD
nr:protein FAM133B [Tanacetum cinerariifolium]